MYVPYYVHNKKGLGVLKKQMKEGRLREFFTEYQFLSVPNVDKCKVNG